MAGVKELTIPIEWAMGQEAARKLLGKAGWEALELDLALAEELARQRKWPLRGLRIERWQDIEDPGWQEVKVILLFNATSEKAERLWLSFLREVDKLQKSLSKPQLERFLSVHHDFSTR